MGTDAAWNVMDPASRGTLLTTLQREADDFFALADEAAWEAPTACTEWQDQRGHGARGRRGVRPVPLAGVPDLNDARGRALR